MKTKISYCALALSLAFGGSFSYASAKEKVACIGNSITYGLTLNDRENTCYPSRLQKMLGDNYEVGNFGHSGSTLLKKGHRPYVNTPEWQAAKEFVPDIAVMHLGTNDTDPRNWPNYSENFMSDYLALIDTLRQLNPNVRIIVANMCPIGAAHRRFETGTRAWRDSIRNVIPVISEVAHTELIDFADPLKDYPGLFPDAVHPNEKGAKLMADYVYGALTGNWGGLKMPEVWQDNMVVPWGKPFKMSGFANAGDKIEVKVQSKKYNAVADNLGRWSVEIAPLKAGGDFPIEIKAGKESLKLNHVTAGEVWLASGQSNMAFMLKQASDTPEQINDDGMVRFFDMLPIAFTDKYTWDADVMEKVNNLEYYRGAKWDKPSDYTSAVAWNFARTLADSLKSIHGFDIPVGIISNAIGGSGTEAWIDMETLEHTTPNALVKWRKNDWLQPWVQERATENSGSDEFGVRHPYEPGYLFASGIRPLNGFPVTGVIWYQGESNAHNVELHETYFTNLVDSWRREFDNPSLPFVFAQLSSINRPSWPSFRDSQRRLAESMDNVDMIVTSDLGNPSDVHPKKKAPVGQRMARMALAKVYGDKNITSSGPMPLTAKRNAKGEVVVNMNNAKGMTTSDGQPIRRFEVAEVDGLYYPAEAKVEGETIILSSPDVKNVKFIRYGWQPYTDANLVNSEGLPTSTFKIRVNN